MASWCGAGASRPGHTAHGLLCLLHTGVSCEQLCTSAWHSVLGCLWLPLVCHRDKYTSTAFSSLLSFPVHACGGSNWEEANLELNLKFLMSGVWSHCFHLGEEGWSLVICFKDLRRSALHFMQTI